MSTSLSSMWLNMRENHESTNNKYLTNQTRLLVTEQVSNKIRGVFIPEDKMAGEAIK